MKRYVMLALAMILLVSSFFVSSPTSQIARVGSGKGEEIKDVDELLDFLNEITKISSEELRVGSNGIGIESLSSKSKNNDEGQNFTFKNESKTKLVQTNKNTVYGSRYNEYSGTYEQVIESVTMITTTTEVKRSLTWYRDGSASYYVSQGVITSKKEADRNKEDHDFKYNFIFDMEVYVEKDETYIKVNQLEVLIDSPDHDSANGDYANKIYANLGKWIDVSDSEDSANIGVLLSQTDSANVDIIYLIQKFIENYLEENPKDADSGYINIEKAEDLVGLPNTTVGMKPTSYDDILDGRFVVDMSNAHAPNIMWQTKLDCDIYDFYSSQNQSNLSDKYFSIKAEDYQNITFSNIGNTIVEFPSNIDFLDEDDAEDFFEAIEDAFKML